MAIIDNLPRIMVFMVQGYIFIGIYNFVLFRSVELKHVFFKSVVISFVLKIIVDGILVLFQLGIQEYSLLYYVSIFLFSAISSLGISLIAQSRWYNRALLKIGIKRTMNQNIWEDIIRPNCWMLVYSKDGERAYYGQYRYGEENAREPIIALMHYQVIDMDGKVLCNYNNDDNRVALLNLNDFERIEITYVNKEKKHLHLPFKHITKRYTIKKTRQESRV